jgi:hypothetical protein
LFPERGNEAAMNLRAKWFTLGVLSASVVFVLGSVTFDSLRDAAMRSKSRRLLANARTIAAYVDRYRVTQGSYPIAMGGPAFFAKAPLNPGLDCDYYSDGTTYTAICPSNISQMKWEPYVIRDGKLVSWPSYMNEDPLIAAARARISR